MKKIIAIAALLLMTVTAANAQIKFGAKAGINVTDMSVDSKVFSSSNRTGFFIGPTAKFTLPVVGLGMDVSVLYDQRSGVTTYEVATEGVGDDNGFTVTKKETVETRITSKKLSIPLNVRYNLLGLGQTAAIYAYGGPQFDFALGNKEYKDWTLRSSNFSANIGLGVMVLNKVQVTANYNVAMGKTGEQNALDVLQTTTNVANSALQAAVQAAGLVGKDAKTNSWQIGVAYYF